MKSLPWSMNGLPKPTVTLSSRKSPQTILPELVDGNLTKSAFPLAAAQQP